MQLGIPYVLTGPDGTRAVFNDPTDLDFVGYLDGEQGITGLLDSADVRETISDKVEFDGSSQGDNFFSRRTGVINATIWPGGSMSFVNQAETKIKRASRGMRGVAPCYLTWTPDGSPQRWLRLWRQGRVTFTGRRPKKVQIPLSSPDPYTYSAAVNSQVLVPGQSPGGDAGFQTPMHDPIITNYAATAQMFVTNLGNAETWPMFIIQGPVVNPTLLDYTVGNSWTLNYSLGGSEFMVVDSYTRTVLLGGTANRYSAYAANFAINQWWSLQPGVNDVRLLATSYTVPGTKVTVQWRHSWE